jgi:hypothetical protein
MHRQPVRVEAFVVRHDGIKLSSVCEVESECRNVSGLMIYECDTKLQLLGERRQSSGAQLTPKHREMLVAYGTKSL